MEMQTKMSIMKFLGGMKPKLTWKRLSRQGSAAQYSATVSLKLHLSWWHHFQSFYVI